MTSRTSGKGMRLVPVVAWTVYLFLMIPSLIVIPISFGNPRQMVFPPDTLSTALYSQFWNSPAWLDAVFVSLRIAVGATALSILVGVPAAYALVRGRFRGKRVAEMTLFSPILIPTIVLSLGLYFYFARIGLAGTDISLILSHAVYVLPFVLVTVMAGLRQIDPQIEIAATILGASAMRSFWSVTLPLLRPSILAAGFFAFLLSFDETVIAYFIANPRGVTLPVKMFSSIQWEVSPVIAVVSTILTVFSGIVCAVAALTLKNRSDRQAA